MTRIEARTAAALAAHRIGFGEALLAFVGSDAEGWLMAQPKFSAAA